MIFVWFLLAAQIAIKIWAFTDGVRLNLPDELVGCILVGRHHLSVHVLCFPGNPTNLFLENTRRIAFTWIAELIFDTAIFALTLWRTVRMYRVQLNHNRPMSLFVLIIRDGIVYFGVIFAANLGNTLVFLLAPDDLKAINASFSTLITTLLVSHLILNLKSAARKTLPESDRSVFGAGPPHHQKARSNGAIGLGSATAISVHVETHVDFGDQDQASKANGDLMNSDILDTKNARANKKGLNINTNGKNARPLSQTQYELSHLSPRTRDHFAFAL
ncbi:hypothetical protein EST38_g5085 [Candolleomyces aberdarensis]|uniref:Uncharacterized protein n=1 Tax=Candolleomyces aberdarensis TaxID=2316362 RepID=A0A4Q2DP78_9AGAR|nr:hypothetical protein EST38_g5085 [Candolleomyces aberdarensis]